MKLPSDFENRMKEYLLDEYEAFVASYDNPEVKGIRLNTLAPGEILGAICNEMKEDLEKRSVKTGEIPWNKDAFYYETEAEAFRPGKHPFHEAGVYYIQEPSAMAPVTYLSVNPGERVLDLCASPGGKSTQIAACLKGEGILISNEIMSDRARILSENIERMGVRNALVISEDPRNISDKFAGFFDKVLVDAPCSGEGMFRRSETAVNEWSLENVRMCADRQKWILDEAAKMLRPGGTLVYSTCTFSKEENEEQMLDFLKEHEDFALSEMTIYDGMIAGYGGVGIRLFPHKVKGEGHYVCKLVKKNMSGDNDELSKIPPVFGFEPDITKKEKSDIKDMYVFFKEVCSEKLLEYIEARRITRFKDQIYLLPTDCPSLKGLKVLRPGLHLGTILKNRFEPGHALAMAITKEEIRNKCNLSLDSLEDKISEIYKYYNGETFNVTEEMFDDGFSKKNPSGWHVIFINGASAGWGKLSNSIMKNHFPKGLRKNLR